MAGICKIKKLASSYQKVITKDLLTQKGALKSDYITSFRKLEMKNTLLAPSPLIRAVLQCSLNSLSPVFDFHQKISRTIPPDASRLKDMTHLELDIYSLALIYLNHVINVGAYTDSLGNSFIRDNIASALTYRDSLKTVGENIKLFDSLAEDFKSLAKCLILSPQDCILFPRPADPVFEYYAKFAGSKVEHFDMDSGSFEKTLANMEDCYRAAVARELKPKGLFFGNPCLSGKVFTLEQLQKVADFAFSKHLIILADESYQQVLINDELDLDATAPTAPDRSPKARKECKEFVSLKKAILTHPSEEVKDCQELISGFSIARSIFPEPAMGGGFLEMVNIDEYAHSMLAKLASVMLAPNTSGQIVTDLSINLFHLDAHFKPETFAYHARHYRKNKENLLNYYNLYQRGLRQIPSFEVMEAEAGFSVWVKVHYTEIAKAKFGQNLRAAERALSEAIKSKLDVLAVPGSEFGAQGQLKFIFIRPADDATFESLRRLVDSFMSG